MRSGALLAVLVLALPATAGAQTSSDPVAARTLFQEARKLAAQKKFDQACPKFEESLKLDAGIGTMFNLADCWEHAGRTASAWSEFLDAASAAKNAGQADRERVAHERASALEPHLSRMVVTVAAPEPGLQVQDGARAVASALYGEAVPVDPGPHKVSASAPGKKPWETSVQVGADGDKVTVAVPALAVDPNAPVAPPPVASATPAPAPETHALPETPPPPAQPAGGTQRTIGWVATGLGAVGVGVGVAFSFATQSKNNDAKALCTSGVCGSQAELDQHTSLVNTAKADRTTAIVAYAAGGALAVAGVVLVLTAPHGTSAKESGALRVVPAIGPGVGGASVTGSF
jgi:hypothetical protein